MSKSQVPQPIFILWHALEGLLGHCCNLIFVFQICPDPEREHPVPCHLHFSNASFAGWYIHDGTHIIHKVNIVTLLNKLSNTQEVTSHSGDIIDICYGFPFSLLCKYFYLPFSHNRNFAIST